MAGRISSDDAEDDANQLVGPPAPPRTVGPPVQQRIHVKNVGPPAGS